MTNIIRVNIIKVNTIIRVNTIIMANIIRLDIVYN